jgi:hypothetical protein
MKLLELGEKIWNHHSMLTAKDPMELHTWHAHNLKLLDFHLGLPPWETWHTNPRGCPFNFNMSV